MIAKLEPIQMTVKLNTKLFHNSLCDFSKKNLTKSIVQDANPAIWIAGHLVSARCLMLNLAGGKTKPKWPDLFGRGSEVLAPNKYPDIEEIKKEWDSLAKKLENRWGKLDAKTLKQSVEFMLPITDRTVFRSISFLAMHESFHIGQIALLRKPAGLEAMTYR